MSSVKGNDLGGLGIRSVLMSKIKVFFFFFVRSAFTPPPQTHHHAKVS